MKDIIYGYLSLMRPSLSFISALLVCIAFLGLGYDDWRILQMALLALPALASLLWPLNNRRWRFARAVAVWLLTVFFLIDGVVRAYLFDLYQASPDSSTVLGAVANTTGDEMGEYIDSSWRPLSVAAALLAVGGLLLALAVRGGASGPATHDSTAAVISRWKLGKVVLIGLLLLSVLAYASKPSRRLHPVLFWSSWAASLGAMQTAWRHQEEDRTRAMSLARAAHPLLTAKGSATVVLVIAESINRDNLAIYGYGRETTPYMSQQRTKLGEHFLLLRNAWSSEASTIPSIHSMLSVGEGNRRLHILALARATGYKVWWISNQADTAIENMHAKLADEVHMLNRTPGRGTKSLDEAVLEPMRAALDDTSPRKLIVVHLMGAHPHYRLRYPAHANPFDDRTDVIDLEMQARDRPLWVRKSRQDYDAALLYHDTVVSASLDLARLSGAAADYRAWMYLSDHGQEVGHSSDKVGHSPATAAGYRIPVLIWQSMTLSAVPNDAGLRPFRSDWADITLAHLLGLRWDGYRPSEDVLSAEYRWLPPRIPAPVASFLR